MGSIFLPPAITSFKTKHFFSKRVYHRSHDDYGLLLLPPPCVLHHTRRVSTVNSIRSKSADHLVAECSAGDSASGSGGDNNEGCSAVETVLKLYSAIRSKNLKELSDIISEECWCVCNFVTAFQPFYGKQQVLELLSSLIRFLGDHHIEFVVQPTLHNGMSVCVSWRLECSKTHLTLGKGFSLHSCHLYRGKLIIKNVDMFLEPLLHMEPLRLKLFSILANKSGDLSRTLHVEKARAAITILISILLVVGILMFFRHHQPYLFYFTIRFRHLLPKRK